MKKCPAYAIGEAIEGYIRGEKKVICNVECPYFKKIPVMYGGEDIGPICKTDGLIKLIDILLRINFAGIKKSAKDSNNPKVNPQPDFVGRDFSCGFYL